MIEMFKNEFRGWKFIEVLWLTIATLTILGLSIYWHETPIGIISAVTGVICVVLTGKGKLSCYAFGVINCIAYAYMAYHAKFYGDFIENAFYYLPMQFVGFMAWKKHMSKESSEVIAERMTNKTRLIYLIGIITGTYVYGQFLIKLGGNLPYLDAVTNVMSVVAMILTVKRYAEQWFLWIIIDIITVAMWYTAFVQNQESIATLVMWMVYLINAIIMFVRWYNTSKKLEKEVVLYA